MGRFALAQDNWRGLHDGLHRLVRCDHNRAKRAFHRRHKSARQKRPDGTEHGFNVRVDWRGFACIALVPHGCENRLHVGVLHIRLRLDFIDMIVKRLRIECCNLRFAKHGFSLRD